MIPAALLVEGGGSTTRAGLAVRGDLCVRSEGASCNPQSVGDKQARANLRAIVEAVLARQPADTDLRTAWFCLSTASTTQALAATGRDLLEDLPEQCAPDALWVSNDMAPLLVHDGRIAERVAVVCGTGTGFCAVNPGRDLSARASGHEHLLSDEGGGFDIGLQGLRAVMRAADGRGPSTAMSGSVRAWRGVTPAALHDLVYGSAEPKVLIASFAPFVLAAAEARDPMARHIVTTAVRELLAGIVAVARRAELSGGFEIALAGSILTASPTLQTELRAAVAEALPQARITMILGSPLDAVARMAALLPGEPRFANLLARTLPFARLRQGDARKAAIA